MDDPHLARLARRIERAFPATDAPPPLTLRGGNALDDYESPPPFDPRDDAVTETYLEAYHFGIGYLDPASWRHYLPSLLRHCLDHMYSGTSSAVDGFLFSLRPPDQEPARFATLSEEQRATVVAVLEALGFTQGSKYQDDALTALQEYWHLD